MAEGGREREREKKKTEFPEVEEWSENSKMAKTY